MPWAGDMDHTRRSNRNQCGGSADSGGRLVALPLRAHASGRAWSLGRHPRRQRWQHDVLLYGWCGPRFASLMGEAACLCCCVASQFRCPVWWFLDLSPGCKGVLLERHCAGGACRFVNVGRRPLAFDVMLASACATCCRDVLVASAWLQALGFRAYRHFFLRTLSFWSRRARCIGGTLSADQDGCRLFTPTQTQKLLARAQPQARRRRRHVR